MTSDTTSTFLSAAISTDCELPALRPDRADRLYPYYSSESAGADFTTRVDLYLILTLQSNRADVVVLLDTALAFDWSL